nr:putative reverse transcriptase domain-containing protein [Tanacetum cinerariifolium]
MADALSQKEMNKTLCIRALMMTVHNDLPKQIHEAQEEVMKRENVKAENLGRLIKQIFKFHPDGTRSDKMYQDLKPLYWWPIMKADIATYILEIASGSVKDKLGYEYRLPPSKMDGQNERTIQTLKDMLRACVIDFESSWDRHLPLVEFSYNNSYHASIKAVPYEALYGRKCRSLIKNHLLTARSRQKSYADKRTKLLEFEVDDMVLLKVLPWKGTMRFENSKVRNFCWEVMEGCEGVVRRWWSGAEMGEVVL